MGRRSVHSPEELRQLILDASQTIVERIGHSGAEVLESGDGPLRISPCRTAKPGQAAHPPDVVTDAVVVYVGPIQATIGYPLAGFDRL